MNRVSERRANPLDLGMPKKSRTTGGQRLKAFLRRAKAAAAKSKGADVGFFASKRYPDGTPTALVAAVHEFGLGHQAEQPVFRTGIESSKREITAVIRRGIDPQKLVMDESTAQQAGAVLARAVTSGIKEAGLVDSGRLAGAVAVRVTSSE